MNHNLKKSFFGISSLGLIGPRPILFCDDKKLHKTQHFLLVDGGVNHKNKITSYRPEAEFLSLGDGDSMDVSQPPLDILLPKNKDILDLEYALQYLLYWQQKTRPFTHLQDLWALGFQGGRSEYELVNYKAFSDFLEQWPSDQPESNHLKIFFDLDCKKALYPKGQHHFDFTGAFSLLSFSPVDLILKGQCQYQAELPIVLRPLSGQGLSNYAKGPFEIISTGPFYLFRPE